MESVNIPSESVPAEMKACEQTLKRAKELVKAEPVVAYWCEFAPPQRTLAVKRRTEYEN
jgi:vacuolar protein sorting-associated protein VTA1